MIPSAVEFVGYTDAVSPDGTSDQLILPANPDRVIVGIGASNAGAATWELRWKIGKGEFRHVINLAGYTLFTWKDWGPLVQSELRLSSSIAGGTLYVYHAKYRGE